MAHSDDLKRYQRQMLLPGVGERGQRLLGDAHALIVGCGALGCGSADLLCRAGVGRLTIIDRDVVELTNLQRQVLFDETDAAEGTPKAEAARRRLAQINRAVRTEAVIADFTPRNAEPLAMQGPLGPPDVIVDGTDNFETRFLLNDLSVKHNIPYAYAGVVAGRGMAAMFLPGEPGAPCLRCLFEAPPPVGSQPTCDTAGVFGPSVSVVTGAQTGEVLKLLLGMRGQVSSSLLEFDLLLGQRRRLELGGLTRDDCPCCAHRSFAFLQSDTELGGHLCGQDAVQVHPPGVERIDLPALAARLAAVGRVSETPFLLRAEITDADIGLTVFGDGRAIVRGVRTIDAARTVYARYIGS